LFVEEGKMSGDREAVIIAASMRATAQDPIGMNFKDDFKKAFAGIQQALTELDGKSQEQSVP